MLYLFEGRIPKAGPTNPQITNLPPIPNPLFHYHQPAFPIKNRLRIRCQAEHCGESVAARRQLHGSFGETQCTGAGLASIYGANLLARFQIFGDQASVTRFSLKFRKLRSRYFHLEMLLMLQRGLVVFAAFGHDAEHSGFPV